MTRLVVVLPLPPLSPTTQAFASAPPRVMPAWLLTSLLPPNRPTRWWRVLEPACSSSRTPPSYLMTRCWMPSSARAAPSRSPSASRANSAYDQSQPSRLRTFSSENRLKSRSSVTSSDTPWARQRAAIRASCTAGPATRLDVNNASSLAQCPVVSASN